MSPATYTFRNEWTLPGRHVELYDVLEDVASYPTWWPQVRAVAAVGEEVALVACRSFLPHTLHVETAAWCLPGRPAGAGGQPRLDDAGCPQRAGR